MTVSSAKWRAAWRCQSVPPRPFRPTERATPWLPEQLRCCADATRTPSTTRCWVCAASCWPTCQTPVPTDDAPPVPWGCASGTTRSASTPCVLPTTCGLRPKAPPRHDPLMLVRWPRPTANALSDQRGDIIRASSTAGSSSSAAGRCCWCGWRWRGIAPLNELQHRIRSPRAMTSTPSAGPALPTGGPAGTAPSMTCSMARLSIQPPKKHFLADAAHQLKTPLAGLPRPNSSSADRRRPQFARRSRSLQITRARQRSARPPVNQPTLARAEDTEQASTANPSTWRRWPSRP